MRIQVRFFAALRERLGVAERLLAVPDNITVAEVWSLAVPDQPLPDNVLAARNMEYVKVDCTLADGDEVAFFPPVTGGGR
ncbi:MAG: MoaD/ThiS family protein [Gammaproteobacteria bacterium]|nr:MAG: MoaD/ThiS family protein [Gammaproteobacteria bacterium]